MERFIGLDAHASSCTVAVVGPSGKRLSSSVLETNAQAIVEYLRQIPRQRRLCIEEGVHSAWLYEMLSPHVDEMVVVAITDKRRGPKSDRIDAFDLAEQLRVGAVPRRVFKEVGRYGTLRALVQMHAKVVQDLVRIKNRIKALYRSRGVSTSGIEVYREATRKARMAELPLKMRSAAQVLYLELDAMQSVHAEAEREVLAEAKKHRAVSLLQTAPGIGPIRAAQIVAVVVSPHRFRTKRQLWSYSGLGILMRSSADYVRRDQTWAFEPVKQTRGLNRCHNHSLKGVFKGAAMTAIGREGPLKEHYERLCAQGTKPNLARLTIARKIAAVVLAMWKQEEVYDPARKH